MASVKPSAVVPLGQKININLGATHHNELVLTNTTFSEMLRFAYHLVSDDQVAGPDWMGFSAPAPSGTLWGCSSGVLIVREQGSRRD